MMEQWIIDQLGKDKTWGYKSLTNQIRMLAFPAHTFLCVASNAWPGWPHMQKPLLICIRDQSTPSTYLSHASYLGWWSTVFVLGPMSCVGWGSNKQYGSWLASAFAWQACLNSVNTRHCPCDVSMSGQHLRRWPNIETTHGQCPVFTAKKS